MACLFNDNVYTKVFTPREYQVELLDTLKERNTIVCLGNNSTKLFLSVKLVQELANEVRRKCRKCSIFILDEKYISLISSYIKHLTDLNVAEISDVNKTNFESWDTYIHDKQIIVLTSDVCLYCVTQQLIKLEHINLLVIDDCRLALKENSLTQLLRKLNISHNKHRSSCRVLGFTSITLKQQCEPARLKAEFEYLEKLFDSSVDTSSDIVTVLRYCSKPQERIVVCKNPSTCDLANKLEQCVIEARQFLEDHRYDPFEIYEEEFADELQRVPDPKVDPMGMIQDFLDILHTLGPWCADKAAFALLIKIEHLKVKTPYERHYLLLAMLSTVFIRIRAICDDEFSKYTGNEAILSNCSPKILRLIEILKTFKPPRAPTNSEKSYDKKGNETSEVPPNTKTEVVEIETVQTVPTFKHPRSGGRNWRNRNSKGPRREGGPLKSRINPNNDQESLCGIVFVQNRFTAKILFHLINELARNSDELSYLSVQYTVEKISDPILGGREAENEHRKQEEVLKNFRMHECNLLVATSVLEEGIDIPKCNLVIRFDQPLTYNSYVQSKGRAKMSKAHYILMSEESQLPQLVDQMARYREIEKMLVTKCNNNETSDVEEQEADMYTSLIKAYVTSEGATVNMSTAIALVNKYCAKLPSDTFTRLTAMWSMEKLANSETPYPMYSCSIRLPINSPLKQTIKGVAMPSKVLAKRIAALQVCKLLHKMGELDDNLMPVGKETFKAFEEDWNSFPMEETDELLTKNNMEPRPGTTKRRQYYYKRIADSLTNCRPLSGQPCYLYLINMNLTCPLPEEQNTRGRKIYPPEDSPQGFGILTSKSVPTICPFPIFTRSGEVQVSFELASSAVVLSEEELSKIIVFLNYVFTNVLRLQKYLMVFEPDSSENNYFIVPTIRCEEVNGITTHKVDWDFLNIIYKNRDLMPRVVEEENRKDFQFDSEKYQDAVVMPWYRNQDQPQYFYVAEVCAHLNPKSSFPGTDYKTFEEYYFKKYNIQIQNLQQPLLDVDHTSARLNFLTPRYVNRKGVALPTSSEETKRAKRENLEQKQILVPELCTIHPFPASLWRKAVCLPCILYRLNALLLADQIRKQVAEELALGQIDLSVEFQWDPLNFGWSLSDVLKKSRESKIAAEAKQLLAIEEKSDDTPIDKQDDENTEQLDNVETNDDKEAQDGEGVTNKEGNKEDEEEIEKIDMNNTQDSENWIEIGTWSNEMAQFNGTDSYTNDWKSNRNKIDAVRYGSPTSWMQNACNDYYDYDTDDSCDTYLSDDDNSESSNKSCGIRIEFKGDNTAEAIDMDDEKRKVKYPQICAAEFDPKMDNDQENAVDANIEAAVDAHTSSYDLAVESNKEDIMSSGVIVAIDEKFEQMKFQDDRAVVNEEYKNKIMQVLLKTSDDVIVLNESQDDPIEALPIHSNSFSDTEKTDSFSFDFQPDLSNHSGPGPSVILQALTMSNANDGINLERLETIGDSFLKYAITNYLYSTYENIHEGKLSHLRSKQVSNLNLYRLGRAKILGESMIATKFDPHDNWLPPCYYVPRELEQALIDGKGFYDYQDFKTEKPKETTVENESLPMENEIKENGTENNKADVTEEDNKDKLALPEISTKSLEKEFFGQNIKIVDYTTMHSQYTNDSVSCFIPYNLITQHSIPDKSIADCVEALIGAYLIDCGPRGALLFMAWLGIRVLPKSTVIITDLKERPVGSTKPAHNDETKEYIQVRFGHLSCPKSPLLRCSPNAENILETLLDGYDRFEESIGYKFRDRSYLLQAMTHASYSPNTVTDCYQRLEFLGDAVLDFLITRHLYNDPRLHSPGALTDLRSALVNNTIFASLAVRHGFHKYFRHLSPGLHEVVNRFVQIQEENGHSISEEYYLIKEDEGEEIEDVEVPKALGDVFESVAGAIFCDSGMSLDAVWKVYYKMMQNEIEQFSTSVPKSPIRELLELEPETAKFGKPEKLADGRRVRVTVEVFGKGTFKGIGRNYRIAKCTAAKCALKQLKKRGMLVRKN